MDKTVESARDAVADIADGSSIAVAGFGVAHRFPSSLLLALSQHGARRLCVYCNGLGQPGHPTAHVLAENHQLARLVTCFSGRPGVVSEVEQQVEAGELVVEILPQGTLVERMRAGGAGLAAVYTPTAVGTDLADGKEVREFGGRHYVLEEAIRVDYAFVRAHRADRFGNLEFRGGSRNFNVSFAKAARITIAEVDEIVEVGEIEPNAVGLPGVFVDRVVRSEVSMDVKNLPMRHQRARDSSRSYNGKPGLTREQIAARAADLLPDGSYVNLGAGLPVLLADYLLERDVRLHSENGILGYGSIIEGEGFDPDIHDAGGYFVSLKPGAAFFESVTSFEIARSGRLSAVVLGAYQVSEAGDLANWATPDVAGGGVGGAMDLAVGARSVIVTMEHTDSKGRPKLVDHCTYPLTAAHCVDWVVTDLALLERLDGRFHLREVAEGFEPEEVMALTSIRAVVGDDVGVMRTSASHA